MNANIQLDQIRITDTYLLSISRNNDCIIFEIDALSMDGTSFVGNLIFPGVENDEWHDRKGDITSIEQIHNNAHRYSSGANEKPDMGSFNTINVLNNAWTLTGDWGYCILMTQTQPIINVINWH